MYLTTFGDGSHAMKSAAKRLASQGVQSGLFDGVSTWSLEKLREQEPEFMSRCEKFILENGKGLGNWIWKPRVLLTQMQSIPLGQIILMLDAGCQLNINTESIKRLEYYRELVLKHSGLFMQLQNGQFGVDDLSDATWTKMATLRLLDPQSRSRESGQIQSGIIFLENTLVNQSFVNNWLAICLKDNFRYLRSEEIHEGERVQPHRWEQSILSLLVKDSNFKYLPDETYFAPDWDLGKRYPIWAMRNRSGGDAYRRNFKDLGLLAAGRLENTIQNRLRVARGLNH